MNVVFIMNDTWRYDHVGANGKIRDPIGQTVQQTGVISGSIGSSHRFKDAIITTLERNVEMSTEAL